ncbi:MAG: efflux RND transporter permease subunit [Mesorhizobium sp.]|uniref:efflux RND transporter permease subunit n=1 Tax=Mesorhizobium sp. TaxID=1871066 RepID=UPI001AC6D4BE|nr:efflux RND transporter permease subunit [Mesorhizobium sp.]MBN9216742.1 efflux RND transporter permease subunit [Mesorhizobium sp.]
MNTKIEAASAPRKPSAVKLGTQERLSGVSAYFIAHPVATTLLMVGILFLGAVAYPLLPVSALPEIAFPTIQVAANLPGAAPDTMASSVAQPLETQLSKVSGVTEMTSSSSLGSTEITVQFNLDRDIDQAASDVQAAITAASGQLPKDLPAPPTFRKVNPADAPVLQLSATSDTLSLIDVDELIETRVAQKISQMQGVAQVNIGGRQKPAIRISVDPGRIGAAGVTLEDVRSAISGLSVSSPKGNIDDATRTFPIYDNDQITDAAGWSDTVVAYRDGGPIRIRDIGQAVMGPEDAKMAHWTNGERGIAVDVFRQPGANVIEVVNRIKQALPDLQASLPASIKLSLVTDRTTTIRASVRDVQFTLMITIALVVMVIFIFLRSLRATLIPAITLPLALLGAAAPMYLLGFSIDNLSLMALVVAVGFVVDDAIVMLENITRHIEAGEEPLAAAFRGSREIGFTIISISLSLIAVLIPILLMGGIVGRLFREFAMTLTLSIILSTIVSLTLTPMMAARMIKPTDPARANRLYRWSEHAFEGLQKGYAKALDVALNHSRLTLAVFVATLAATAWLFVEIPKGFFPDQDTGFIGGQSQAAAEVSYPKMVELQERISAVVMKDPAVYSVFMDIGGGNGGNALNQGHVNITLKPLAERDVSAQQVIARLKPELAKVEGIQLFMQAAQDINIGARPARTQYQFTLEDSDVAELDAWAPKVVEALKKVPEITDVASDQQKVAPTLSLKIDRAAASLFGVAPQTIDDTLYDAFGQRQVGQFTTQTDTFHVVLEVLPRLQHDLQTLDRLSVKAADGTLVPLGNIAHWTTQTVAPVSINHQGQFPATTVSFNLVPGASLGEATQAVTKAFTALQPPASLTGAFAGSAQAFQDSLATVPLLIGASLVVVYLILGVLYESFVHPLTILSTLPSAALGALAALMLAGLDFSLVAMIGVILLIGIVKKNGIMLVDFAITAEQNGATSLEAIREAALLRFRPILMTTMAAILGGIPLMLGHGSGAEIRQPLGYAIVGGLIVSQILTLFTTPVIYLTLDRLRRRDVSPAREPAAEAAMS